MNRLPCGMRDLYLLLGDPSQGSARAMFFGLVMVILGRISLMVGIVTNRTGVFDYALVDYLDTRPGVPFDGMIYQNAEVTNCSVPKISLGFTSGVFSDQVCCMSSMDYVVMITAGIDSMHYVCQPSFCTHWIPRKPTCASEPKIRGIQLYQRPPAFTDSS